MSQFSGALAVLSALVGFAGLAQSVKVPRIWNDADLTDWATPVATLNVRPAHFSEREYYAVPADNLKTYPVYHPDAEPPGYWDDLQKRTPEPLVDASRIQSTADWIAAGTRAFREMDSVLMRTNDPSIIGQARDPASFKGVVKLRDGTTFGPRWVVTDTGVMLSISACGQCHRSLQPDGSVAVGGPGGAEPGPATGGERLIMPLPLLGAPGTARRWRTFYEGDTAPVAFWREFHTPWISDDPVAPIKDLTGAELQALGGPGGFRAFANGVFARANGSPYFVTKIPDLQNLKYSRYMDATGTHRLRGPEDVARYAALVTGVDPMDFGPHRILTDAQRRIRYRYADEVLYAIGVYLMSLEPKKNPNPAAPNLIAQGEAIFTREGCIQCHTPPAYSSGKLTLAQGWSPPADHPNQADIVMRSVGTDPGLALKTRKGTGFYKVPSLRGAWYRPLLLHDGALTSLEEMFDPARLADDYTRTGWTPAGRTTAPVMGHQFGLGLKPDEKTALLAFLRSL
jgi:mono/diheme cytochrome c family protein